MVYNKDMEQHRDPETIEKLKKLAVKLFTSDMDSARTAAHNLSWMQEDGLAILKQALFGDFPKDTKKAAAYGLRKMNGRMKTLAIDVLKQGLESRDRDTKAACEKSLQLIDDPSSGKPPKPKEQRKPQRPRNKGPRKNFKRRNKPAE